MQTEGHDYLSDDRQTNDEHPLYGGYDEWSRLQGCGCKTLSLLRKNQDSPPFQGLYKLANYFIADYKNVLSLWHNLKMD